jgi:hypothetical protein
MAPPEIEISRGANMATLPSKPFFLEKIERRVKDNFPGQGAVSVQDREEKDMGGACWKIMAQSLETSRTAIRLWLRCQKTQTQGPT